MRTISGDRKLSLEIQLKRLWKMIMAVDCILFPQTVDWFNCVSWQPVGAISTSMVRILLDTWPPLPFLLFSFHLFYFLSRCAPKPIYLDSVELPCFQRLPARICILCFVILHSWNIALFSLHAFLTLYTPVWNDVLGHFTTSTLPVLLN